MLTGERDATTWTFTWNAAPEGWRAIFPCAFESCSKQPTHRLTVWRGGIMVMSPLTCSDHHAGIEGREHELRLSWTEIGGLRIDDLSRDGKGVDR